MQDIKTINDDEKNVNNILTNCYQTDNKDKSNNQPQTNSRESWQLSDLQGIDEEGLLININDLMIDLKLSKTEIKRLWKIAQTKLKQTQDKLNEVKSTASVQYLYERSQRQEGQFRSDNGELYKWTGVFWKLQDDQDGKNYAYKWLETNTDQSEISEKMAKSCYETLIVAAEKMPADKSDIVFPVENGWLKFNENFDLIATQPDSSQNVRMAAKIKLDMKAGEIYQPKPVPNDSYFYQFLNSSLPDIQDQELYQEYAGYTFTKDYRFQNFLLCIGEGGDGKGILKRLIEKLHYKPQEAILDSGGFDNEHLTDASIILVSDSGKKVNTAFLKGTTGGDASMVRGKYKKTATFRIDAKWIVSANHQPQWNDPSNAIWSRLLIIKFLGGFRGTSRADNALEYRIQDNELNIVFDWILEGAVRLYKRGCFLDTPKLKHLREELRGQDDNTRRFFNENEYILDDSGPNSPKTNIYNHYMNWCHETGCRPSNDSNFWLKAKTYFGDKLADSRPRNNSGSRIRVVNIKMANDNRPSF